MKNNTGNKSNSVLLIGGRDAGKSNFLFRLWIAIDSGSGAIIKDGLPDDIEYLRAGAERLLEGEFAERTAPEVNVRVEVPVKSSVPEVENSGTLIVPDVPGEQILKVYRDRQWSQNWEELITSQCACLLFIRAGSNEIVSPLDWVTCFEKYGAIIETVGGIDSENIQPEEGDESSDPPTQVVLTEWLQFLRTAFTKVVGGYFRPRVGVVISAWDAVPIDQQSEPPEQYIKDNFPMLHQFIKANKDRFDFHLFGVSIVSGDLKNDDDFKKSYLRGIPQDFGVVVHSLSGKLTKSPDITLPVAWALRLLHSKL